MIRPSRAWKTTNTTETTYTDYPEYEVAILIWKTIAPILIIVGTVGSVLSLSVLCRRKLRRLTTMFYLSVLAVTDLFVLYTGLLRYWINNTFGIDVRLFSDFSCKIHVFFVYTSLDYAAWILVALTVDRCFCVWSPFRARKYCTLRNARFISLGILITLVLLNIHMMWTYGLSSRTIFGDGVDCDAASENFVQFVSYVWAWIDFAIVCFIPFSIMIVCNCIIIRQLTVSASKIHQHKVNELMYSKQQQQKRNNKQDIITLCDSKQTAQNPDKEQHCIPSLEKQTGQHDNRQQHLNPQQLSQQHEDRDREQGHLHLPPIQNAKQQQLAAIPSTSDQSRAMNISTIPTPNNARRSQSKRKVTRPSSLTVMLLSVNCLFLMMTSPIVVFLVGFATWRMNPNPQNEAQLLLGWSIVNMFQYANNAVHFFLYCMSGQRFRQEFVSMVSSRKKVHNFTTEPSHTRDSQ